MKRQIKHLLLTCLLISTSFLFATSNIQSTNFSTSESDSAIFDINRICNYFSNNGSIVDYSVTGNAGLEWPKGSGLTTVFQSGIWIAGLVDGQIRSAVAEYTSEYQPGNVSYNPDAQNPEAGIPNDPNIARFKIYTINKGDSPDPSKVNYNPDYANWPVADGAPAHDGEYFTDSNENGIYDSGEEFEDFDLDGVYDAPDGQIVEGQDPPLLLGDQTHWCIYNDLNPSDHFFASPIGIEVRTTIFGLDRSDELGNVMFLKWLIINKGGNTIDSTYISMWSDPDIGEAFDDYVGCDTTLNVGYCYNRFAVDSVYGTTPPCVGYDLIQGPIIPSTGDTALVSGRRIPDHRNLSMTSFAKFSSGSYIYDNPGDAQQIFNYMKGKNRWGESWITPDSEVTMYLYPGDPVTGTGYIENDDRVSDRNFLMTSGPFTLESWSDANGDSIPQVGEPGVQEIVGAIIIAAGTNNLDAINQMKDAAKITHCYYLDNIKHPTNISERVQLASDYSLYPNYPNPFNPTTTITYNLPKPAFTEIRIYNLAGQLVQTLLNEVKPAGQHQIIWDAGDLPSGIYFYQIKVEDHAGSGVQTKKCVLLK